MATFEGLGAACPACLPHTALVFHVGQNEPCLKFPGCASSVSREEAGDHSAASAVVQSADSTVFHSGRITSGGHGSFE